jgi:hypothetical protein
MSWPLYNESALLLYYYLIYIIYKLDTF